MYEILIVLIHCYAELIKAFSRNADDSTKESCCFTTTKKIHRRIQQPFEASLV
jgi:hypothetical protein